MISQLADRGRFLLLLTGYLLVTLAYGVLNPLFEAPDEHHHFFTAQYIAQNGRLPVAGAPDTAEWVEQEAAQPPLYYLLGSLLVRPLDLPPPETVVWLNPYVQLGDASAPNNHNRVVHTPAEAWPWRGTALAVHILRALSTLFGAGTLVALYACARLVWPDAPQRALLATALVAFLPQFNFLHSYVNNDVAVICLASLTLWQLLWLWQSERPLATQPLWRFAAVGTTAGLALLSKTAGLLLIAYAGAFVGVLACRQAGRAAALDWRALVRAWLSLGGSALIVAGWWLWRNWRLYGDITAANQFVSSAGSDRGFTLFEVLGESSGIWRSLIAVFGWLNIVPPLWIYWLWNALVVLALIGAARSLWRRRSAPGVWLLPLLLTGWVALVYAGMVAFMLKTPAAQGRLLLPTIVVLALGCAYGLAAWHATLGRALWLLVPGVPLLTTLFCLLRVIPPAYTLPPTDLMAPADVAVIHRQLGDNLTLSSGRLLTTRAQAGDNVWIDLYWERGAVAPATGDAQQLATDAPEMVYELFGRANTPVGKLQTYHGGGLFPANLWPANARVRERVRVRLDAALDMPTQVRINALLVGGESVDLGYFEVEPAVWPQYDGTLATIGDGIEVVTATLRPTTARAGDLVTVDVVWRVRQAPGIFLTTLVHLGPIDAPPLAQADRPPLNGDYPTIWWDAGETIVDAYELHLPSDLPPGRYPLRIGLYDATVIALPVRGLDAAPDGRSLIVGYVTIP